MTPNGPGDARDPHDPTDTITVPELEARLRSGAPTVVIDIRLADVGGIPGAVHIPVTDLEDDPRPFDPESLLVVYCQHGRGASQYAQEVLREQGYPRVVRLEGGLDAWREAHPDS
jgi:thiosulfate sulfurtransferase